MPDQKDKILDALLGDNPGTGDNLTAQEKVHLKALFRDLPVTAATDEFAARRLWNQFTASREKAKPKVWKTYIYVPLAIAALALVAVFIGPKFHTTAPDRQITTKNTEKKYADSVQVYIRQAENYAAERNDSTLQIKSNGIVARIDFHATAEIKTVKIETPWALFEIVGTKIALNCSVEKSSLHVFDGKVRVTQNGQSSLIGKGEVWVSEQGKSFSREAGKADDEVFTGLKTSVETANEQKAKSEKPLSAEKPLVAPKVAVKVRIALNDGTEISGNMVRESADRILVRVPLAGNREVEIERKNIQSIVKDRVQN